MHYLMPAGLSCTRGIAASLTACYPVTQLTKATEQGHSGDRNWHKAAVQPSLFSFFSLSWKDSMDDFACPWCMSICIYKIKNSKSMLKQLMLSIPFLKIFQKLKCILSILYCSFRAIDIHIQNNIYNVCYWLQMNSCIEKSNKILLRFQQIRFFLSEETDFSKALTVKVWFFIFKCT